MSVAKHTSLSLSKKEGSFGGGPSSAQRRDSYFERINDSILLKRMVTTSGKKAAMVHTVLAGYVLA